MRVYWPHRCPGSGGDKRGPAFQAAYYQLLMPGPPASPLIFRSITQITQIFDIMMGHSRHHALLDDHLNKCHLGPTFKALHTLHLDPTIKALHTLHLGKTFDALDTYNHKLHPIGPKFL